MLSHHDGRIIWNTDNSDGNCYVGEQWDRQIRLNQLYFSQGRNAYLYRRLYSKSGQT